MRRLSKKDSQGQQCKNVKLEIRKKGERLKTIKTGGNSYAIRACYNSLIGQNLIFISNF